MSWPWSPSNVPRSARPGSRNSAAIARTATSATASNRFRAARRPSFVAAAGPTDASVGAGAADRSALRVAAADHRLDQPVVALASPVQDGHPLVLRVHEHEERVPELLHSCDSILFEHRLDGEALDLHDPAASILAGAAGIGRDLRAGATNGVR